MATWQKVNIFQKRNFTKTGFRARPRQVSERVQRRGVQRRKVAQAAVRSASQLTEMTSLKDHTAALRELLASDQAAQPLKWSKKHFGETAASVFRTDKSYVLWVVRQYNADYLSTSSPRFTQTARLFKDLLEHSYQLDLAQRTAVHQAAIDERNAKQARLNAVANEENRVKRLRRSTANGQLESALSFDLLMHVCMLTDAPTTLTRLPCVSRSMRAVMGTSIERLPVIAKLVYRDPCFVPNSRPASKTSQLRPLTLRMLCKFLIQPTADAKGLVARGETAFIEQATRTAAHTHEFQSIRQQAGALRNDAVQAYIESTHLLCNAFDKGNRKKLDDGGCSTGCTALVRATNTALEKRDQYCALLKKLDAMNTEHKLGVVVPHGRSPSDKIDRFLVGV